jgi:hypothetical protein
MNKTFTVLALSALLLLPGGCCYVADWMGCYPDSPLYAIGWRTPTGALETFRRAALYGDVDTIYLCLSQKFKRAYQLDNLATHLFWPKMQEQIPFLRSAFRADIAARYPLADGRRAIVLAAAGHRIQVILAPEPFVEVLAYDLEKGKAMKTRVVLDDDLPPEGLRSVIRKTRSGGLVTLLQRPDWLEDLQELDKVDDLAAVTVGVDWKIDGFKQLNDE